MLRPDLFWLTAHTGHSTNRQFSARAVRIADIDRDCAFFTFLSDQRADEADLGIGPSLKQRYFARVAFHFRDAASINQALAQEPRGTLRPTKRRKPRFALPHL